MEEHLKEALIHLRLAQETIENYTTQYTLLEDIMFTVQDIIDDNE